jgi:glycosyltransferase involved in cell wall biosynthesis
MKKVLFIAYYFPPMGGSGVQRSLKFVKYLHKFGVEPTVLTVNPFYARWPKDLSLVGEIPSGTKVYRTPTIDMNWFFKILWGLKLNYLVTWLQLNVFVPDPEITWLPFAIARLKKILKHDKFDLAYITGGPYSSMLLGPYLKDVFNTDYIVDFRDEWTNSHIRLDFIKSAKAIKRDNLMEEEVLRKCSGLIYTHPIGMQDNFENKYPFLKSKPFRIITNGYDESDFLTQDSVFKIENNSFEIVYSGSFYDRRKPDILFRAIKTLVERNQINPDHFRIKIIGKNTPSFVLGDFNNCTIINNIVRFHKYSSHKQVIDAVNMASLLLLFLAPGPNSEPEIPGKLFEYLRSYIPIMAIVPPNGAAAEIVRKSKTGYVLNSDSEEEVCNGLRDIYHTWMEGKLKNNPDIDFIDQFNRERLTEKLVSLFDEVTSSKPEEICKLR